LRHSHDGAWGFRLALGGRGRRSDQARSGAADVRPGPGRAEVEIRRGALPGERAGDTVRNAVSGVLPDPQGWGSEGDRRNRPAEATVITNERQYRITRAWAARFAEALEHVDEEDADQHPVLRQARREQYESQLAELEQQLAACRALRQGKIRELTYQSLRELPDALVEGRIAAGLTQRELVERVGVLEQQIQR